MRNWLRRVRRVVRSTGFDICRWPDPSSYAAARQQLFTQLQTDLVIDVGANSGQYGTLLRENGFRGRIVSFEPLTAPFAALSAVAAGDENWDAHNLALGAEDSMVTMNVAANDGASTSVLPMLDTHRDAAPEAVYIGTESARQLTLDGCLAPRPRRGHLKVDVQGYEWQVLDGAPHTIAACRSIELELSMVPLYDGGPLFAETVARVRELGFELATLTPTFRHPQTGVLLQVDGLFIRNDDRTSSALPPSPRGA